MTNPTRRLPRMGFIGIHAGTRNDRPVSQNETIAALFAGLGYHVRGASAIRPRLFRTLHQAFATLRWSRSMDVVVLATFSGRSFWYADMCTALCRLTGLRVIMVLHGGRLPEYSDEHPKRVMRVLRRADLLVAPSEYLARWFRGKGLEVVSIPNVLAIERYEYTRREAARPALLWMRTFHEHYAPAMALDVLARVRAVHPETTLIMGGADYGLLEATKAHATALGLDDAVTFAGYMDAEAKRAAFAGCDIFLNTNVIDNMPVSVLEVGAAGLVPVATDVGGIPDLLTDDLDSFLVPSGDADAMAAAVLRLLDEPETYARLALGARALAERSAWPAVQRLWIDQLRLLLPDLELP